MTTMKGRELVVVVLLMLAVCGRVEGGRRRGCRGSPTQPEQVGDRFMWTMSGLDENNLRVTYLEGAFAPEGADIVMKYPVNRHQRALGLTPAKVIYDFADPDNPVVAIRQGRRGRGSCIVLQGSDVESYESTMAILSDRNGTNLEMLDQVPARWEASSMTDDSSLSDALRDICSKDHCGRTVDATYYTAVLETVTEEEAELEEEVINAADIFEPRFLLLQTPVVISGLPSRRQLRLERRQQRRQQRRQDRRQGGRQNRREERRQQRLQARINRRREAMAV